MDNDNKDFLINKKFNHIVCMCMRVTYAQIVQEIGKGAITFSQLYDNLKVSSGCGSCKMAVKKILKRELEKLEK